jgi:REP element-mobilizing transposase RayT
MLDRRTAEPMLLANPRYARMVRNSLLRAQSDLHLCTLNAWVVLHNHIHAVLAPHAETIQIAEAVMNHSEMAAGSHFWERESYVRVLRTESEIAEAVRFIEQHPVRSGLVLRAEDWEYSSAFRLRARWRGGACQKSAFSRQIVEN